MCAKSDTGVRVPSVELCNEGLAYYEDIVRGALPVQGSPQCLLDLGLLQELPDGQLMPLPPGLAANAVMRPLETDIEQKQRALAAARIAMHKAEEVYRAHTGSGTGSGIRAISGADAISATLSSVVQSCREELLTAQPGGGRPSELLGKALTSDVAALERGVRQRTIYQHTVRTHGPTLAYVEQISVAGAEVRTLNEVFDRLIVCDRKIAFVPDPGEERRQLALVIEHPGMIRYLVGIFDKSWERAAPLRHTPSEHRPPLLTDETRRAVLHLMVNGYTDDTIAGRLGMSARTVATHVGKASEQFGSRSRAQLAYLIGRSGILDEELYGLAAEGGGL
ncbi:LuxR C-terminal-related transcriptional regulator [Streptomyces antarcticus]|uniref:LuxR C-terminal-related transcriptional regulator n=1 Tax=Streptomyces antarcticus TaxID=2996458 RepID=UPI00226F1A57|nr:MULTISPECIES: LuxR C-terminal-related transcriptional regulator [unclassified Streptomyces]MCY0946613.1 LuxR C-terminal-related transcriptional regulator [Streptomyces sp. H34-AA3]MCZ4085695.1 LuxR C-terminal-related transcriptional regulator [Streptomyces sp. H34-S5]